MTSGNQERGKDISKDEHYFAVKPEKVVESQDNIVEVNANSDDSDSDYEPANAMRKALTMIFSKVKTDETGSNERKVEGGEETPSRTKDSLEKLESDNGGKEALVTDEFLKEAAGQGKASEEIRGLKEAAGRGQTSDECSKEATGQGQTSDKFFKEAAGQGKNSNEFLKEASGEQKSDQCLKEARQGQKSDECLDEAAGKGQRSDECLKETAGKRQKSDESFKEASGGQTFKQGFKDARQGQKSVECVKEAAGQGKTSDECLKEAAGQGPKSDESLKEAAGQGPKSDDCVKEAREREKSRNASTPKESVNHMIEMITSMFDPPCLGNRGPDGDESFLDRKLKRFTGDNLKPPCLFHEDAMHKTFEEESTLYSDDMSKDVKKTLKAYYGMAGGFTSGTTVATDSIEQEKQEEKEAYNITAQEWETLDSIFKERIHLKDSVKFGENYVHIPPDPSSLRQIQADVVFDDLEKKASCRHGWSYPDIVIGGGSVVLASFVVYRYFR